MTATPYTIGMFSSRASADRSDGMSKSKPVTKWTANFDRDGSVTLTPDTPETRRDLEQTLHDFHSGRLRIVYGKK